MTRIIGIDPGSRFTGYGIIEGLGNQPRYVASGCIRINGTSLGERLRIIFDSIQDIVLEYEPDELAIEKVFVQRNVDSALKLGQARGAAICASMIRSLPVYEYAPNQIKKAVVGQGHATKEQVQHMVRILLGLREALSSDAADALACALCHSQTRSTLIRLEKHANTVSRGGRR